MDLLADISEKAFQQTVRDLAELCGWLVFCTWDSRHSPAGEPDLRLIHPRRKKMIWAELKAEKGRVTEKQQDAIETLTEAGQVVYLWRPSDWNEIEKVLT